MVQELKLHLLTILLADALIIMCMFILLATQKRQRNNEGLKDRLTVAQWINLHLHDRSVVVHQIFYTFHV